MNRWICWITGLWRSRWGNPIDGCDLEIDEENVPALVTTSRCAVCRKWSIAWKRKE